MADQLQFRGGTTSEVSAASVASREIIIDTQTNEIAVGTSKKKTVMQESNGDVEIGGGNIDLNASGSATFADQIKTFTQGNPGPITSFSPTPGLQLLSYGDTLGNPYTKTSAIVANADGTAPSILELWTKSNGSSSPSKQAVIDSSGNVLIGGTLPASPNIELNSDGSIVAAADATINSVTVGRGGGSVSTNTTVGQSALSSNTIGIQNTAIGQSVLFNNTEGLYNSALGQSALNKNTTGDSNTAVGRSALFSNTVGSQNTAVGRNAGYYIGGSNNTILGAYQGTSADATLSGTVIISAGTTERARCNSSGTWQFAGSVSIGGTAAANTIDEYEEGTFTPAVVGGTTPGTPTYGTNGIAGKYVRVGQTCHIEIYIDVATLGGAVGVYRINGLPFNASFSGFGNGYMRMFSTVNDIASATYGTHNTNYLFIKTADGTGNLAVQTGKVTVNASYTIL